MFAALALLLAFGGTVAGADPPSWAHGAGHGPGGGGNGGGNGWGNGQGGDGHGHGGQGGGPPPWAQGNGPPAPPAQTAPATPAPSQSAQPQGGDGGGDNPGHGGTPPGQDPGHGGGHGHGHGHGDGSSSPPTAPGSSTPVQATNQPPVTPAVTTPITAPPVATPASPAAAPVTSIALTPSPAASGRVTIAQLGAFRGGRAGALRAGRVVTSGTGATALLLGSPLTFPLAPATAQAGTQIASAPARTVSHSHHRAKAVGQAPANGPTNVITRFISRIPALVWIALGAALGIAAMAGGTAVAFGRRARRRADEVVAATAAASTDQLTGVLNRRGFTDSAERELERARRYGHPLALAYVDVRGLKAVNDSEGHLAGDHVLREVAVLLSESARTHDLVGRLGGDELAVLLAEQAAPGADAMTRRVREQVPAHRDSLGLSTDWDVTIGTASFPDDGHTLEELVAAADRRLYEQRGIELR